LSDNQQSEIVKESTTAQIKLKKISARKKEHLQNEDPQECNKEDDYRLQL
jgi:hypothetical protein